MARLSRPETYSPNLPRFGVTAWEYDMCKVIYDNATVAAELLAQHGALEYRHCLDVTDYWAELPEVFRGTLTLTVMRKVVPRAQHMFRVDFEVPTLAALAGNFYANSYLSVIPG